MELTAKTIMIIVLALVVAATVIVGIFMVQKETQQQQGEYADIFNRTISGDMNLSSTDNKIRIDIDKFYNS